MQANSKKILQEWEDEVSTSLVQGFRQLFESSSQVLLEFADAAENNRLQRLFFDAQREFYLKEESIINEFERHLRENLLPFGSGSVGSTKLGADTLSLVEVEDYERSLALETIAKRTVDHQLRELHCLAQRLSALLGGRPISIEDVPAHPLQIIRIFDPVSRKLDVESEVRLVFYTLFDRYVMSRLGELYASFNHRLIGLGILPNIKFEYLRSGSGDAGDRKQAGTEGKDDSANTSFDDAFGSADDEAAGGAGTAAAATGGSAQQAPGRRLHPKTPTSTETLAAISSLLMAKRRQQDASLPPLQTSTPILPTAANVGEAIGDVRVLQEAPHPLPIPSGPVGSKVTVDADLLKKVKRALQRQRQIIKSLVGNERLDRREEDVIDIVGMLFEAMLNEKLLPNSVKTLLSHLHTRYLKIAVQSTDFLDNTAHPARRLFERMLDAGIRWVREDNLRAGIYPQLQDIVTQILKHETLEDSFFTDQIEQLDKAEKRLEQQSSASEERTLEAERGRARLDEAKLLVKDTIADISADIEIAPEVDNFLATTYADYLTLLLLRNNLDTASQAWSNAHSIGEALVAAAVYAAKGQPLGQEMRSDLTQRLEKSIGSLIPHHDQNIRRVMEALGKPAEKAAPAPKKAGSAPAETAPASPQSAPTAAAPTRATTPAKPPAAAAPATAEAAEEPISDEDRKVADKLMREAGNWFVMLDREGGSELGVKLLWVNPHTRNMLFVDQHGAKVALMPAGTVARKIREGSMRPLAQETSSFVARSLRRIRRALEDTVNA